MTAKKVLIVESDKLWQNTYKGTLRGVFITSAPTLKEAAFHWEHTGPYDCVVVCGFLHDPDDDTIPFVKMARQTFQGPIVAASNNSLTREALMAAGCSHQVPESKHDTAAVVREALGL